MLVPAGSAAGHQHILTPVRGYILGSRNVTACEILDRHTQCYQPLPELQSKVGSALQADRIITYCGAGAAAASLANVLVRLGRPRVAIYDGVAFGCGTSVPTRGLGVVIASRNGVGRVDGRRAEIKWLGVAVDTGVLCSAAVS